ncbi:serine/threonine protein kinase [Nostoc linckia z18]|uniref:Serine/threonine protein kinase n=3 Tax=Nostoc linckia TaxID=92942 RepID=A0A9Q5Z4I4_NOSLI|nr:serine/threonine-protein kinase [Nostoc linckia]PHK17041.1 serine/threonine protein kinase [Nostoc linckia z15]PHK41750.1 serine/threonine protein kinase [Nostoc linckia z16]PHJ64351.1 serine/threonine protein kinase [Nostoc linckia z1]PHJ70907.1 serine/threonine protein kinase [Nostoc linckia z3]PHJ74168.1 serine/threonine protein kinase [Nostoc linckia z2]
MNQSPFASTSSKGLLANRYQLKQLIGSGGMGEVFLANDILLGGTPVAIKFLTQTVVDSKMQQDFAREALMSAALSQKSVHIVRAYDYGVSEKGKPYYVMEYLLGKSLKELIPLSLSMFLTISRQICLGLQCAHQGINIDGKICPLVHRDIKPANILVIPDPILGHLVKILDFGIAKCLNYASTASTSTGFNGTLPYCSPEQLDGEKLDGRSDIYSLGVMMFEMLTGKKPWEPETDFFGAWYKAHHFEQPKAIADVKPNLKLPQKLNNLIMACLAKKASDRPQNIAQVLQILNSLEPSNCPTLPTTLASRSILSRPLDSGLTISLEQTCRQLSWPENKPIQEIVFPQLVNTGQKSVAALWLMLPQQQIKSYALSGRYNQFIFITSPHPMLLWVTLLYHRQLAPKWLPCYLDMQNPQNRKLLSSLAENERYPLIFFSLESPHSCAHILSSRIDLTQCQMLKNWVEQSQSLPSTSQPHLSKQLLKKQYKKMQLKILQQLESKPQVVLSGSI